MSETEIQDLAREVIGNHLSDIQCRAITFFMIGYLRSTRDNDPAGPIRQDFFSQIKQYAKKPLPTTI